MNAKEFNEKFKKVTKSDYDDLTPVQKRMFDASKRLGLIAAASKSGGTFSKTGPLTVFDPTTYERVSRKDLQVNVFTPNKERKREQPLGTKRYDSDTGMALPTSSPLKYASRGKDFMNGGAVMKKRGGTFKGTF
jgi:hypothetical protein